MDIPTTHPKNQLVDDSTPTHPNDQLHGAASSIAASSDQITAEERGPSTRRQVMYETVSDDDDTMPPLEEVPRGDEKEVPRGDEKEVPRAEEKEEGLPERGGPKEAVGEDPGQALPREAAEADAGGAQIEANVPRCHYCGSVHESEVSLIRHQNGLSHHYCFTCKRRYRNWAALVQHLTDSQNHNFCSECEVDFQSPSVLQAHRQVYHSGFLRPFAEVILCISVLAVLLSVLVGYGLSRLL